MRCITCDWEGARLFDSSGQKWLCRNCALREYGVDILMKKEKAFTKNVEGFTREEWLDIVVKREDECWLLRKAIDKMFGFGKYSNDDVRRLLEKKD